MKIKTGIIWFILCFVAVGCTNIPENASVLNQSVSEGIKVNQVEVEKLIKALADVERAILDQKWDSIYAKVEEAYIHKNSIADASVLTQDQRRAVAATAAQAYIALKDKIAAAEASLIGQARANSQVLIQLNDTVTKYLLSVEELDTARTDMTNKLADLVGVDLSSLPGLAKNLIGGL